MMSWRFMAIGSCVDSFGSALPAFGAQIYAPKPFDSFRAMVRYYYAGDTDDGRVHLAWFSEEKHGRKVRLITLQRSVFEAYLTAGEEMLELFEVQLELPEWLTEDQGINFQLIEGNRLKNPKRTIKEQCDDRLLTISVAVERQNEILASADPLAMLNKLARDKSAKVHPHRFQVWFYAYVLHDEELWALKRARGDTGKWDRTNESHGDSKFGMPSSDDDNCFNSPSWRAHEAMRKFYLSKCDAGISMRSIWIGFLTEKCKCKVVNDKKGQLTFTRSDGGAIFSYGQFRNCIVERFGLDAVQKAKYGAPRIRLKKTTNDGDYSSQYARILEGFEVDAYFCPDRPKQILFDGPADLLVVAVGVDPKTSSKTGVGFSIGAENGEAYRAALFCSVVPRAYTERMYGIPKGHLDGWHVLGYPANFRSDRGPAGHRGLVKDLQAKFPIQSVVPSSEPMSKATTEGGHPRHTKLEGTPTYVVSDLNVVQMIRRELYKARLATFKQNIASKLSDQEIVDFQREGLSATPHDYAGYLLRRLATAGRSMTIERAVRAFWTPTEFKICADGVRHRQRIFTSKEYMDSDVRKKLGTREIDVSGYCLSAVFAIVWVELDGRLVEVSAKSKSRQDQEDYIMPKDEVEKVDAMRGKVEARTRRTGAAAESQSHIQFEESNNVKWSAGTRRSGTPKRSEGMAAQETAVIRGKDPRRKRA
jgi:hypothetical protein